MLLRIWIKQSGHTVQHAADLVGVHRVTMHEYLAGTKMPRPRVLESIRVVTGGQVQASDILASRQA